MQYTVQMGRLARVRTMLKAGTSGVVLATALGVLALSPAFAQQDTIETVVVSGIRESLESAMNLKRNKLEVVDAIVAEDIGKLQDSNVAETMTRIPGVQGYRYGGEGASPASSGSGLTIRGLSGQTAAHMDGRAFFSAGQREFNVEEAIPGMVAGIDVYKNPSAEHIEGGIGGVVDIRTHKPFDFTKETFSASLTGRYNELVGQMKPEYFAMYSNRWKTGNLGEMGLLFAIDYQQVHNRSDNNPSGAGAAIYTTTANGDGTYNLAAGTTSSSAASAVRNGQISFAGMSSNVNIEDILRTRFGYNLGFQWKFNDQLDFYSQVNYDYYLYHQKYQFLAAANSTKIRDLTTTGTNQVTEMLVNRNADGGTNEVLAGLKVQKVTYVGDTFTATGGMEYHPFLTMQWVNGVNWHPTEDWDIRFDIAYLRATQKDDNRSVAMVTKSGLAWDVSYDLTTSPHKIAISGNSLADPNSWVFSNFTNGTNNKVYDHDWAESFDAKYVTHLPILTDIKFGVRIATQTERYFNYAQGAVPLTTDGKTLAADQSNAISATGNAYFGNLRKSVTNWMDGEAGYSGGFLTYSPDDLGGDAVKDLFTTAAIHADDALPETIANRRYTKETTYAGYIVAEYAAFGDFVEGNAGVRLVSADDVVTGMVAYSSGAGYYENTKRSSEFDALPSVNVNFNLSDELKLKLGYSKGLTRPTFDALNPTVSVNYTGGTGSLGNASLKAETADSYDISIEQYFGGGAYVSLAVFDKEISGFFNSVSKCMSVDNFSAYTGTTPNGCSSGQYFVSQTVNAGSGYARGVELAGQTFFDFLPGIWSKFGVEGSYSYVETSSPVRFTTNGAFYDVPQPYQSKHNVSLSGMYDDGTMSGRLVYTYRSPFVFSGVTQYPMNDRVVGAYGILDASFAYEVGYNLSLTASVSNLTNAAPNRYIGEPGRTHTSFERQHYLNGRIFSLGVRFRTGD